MRALQLLSEDGPDGLVYTAEAPLPVPGRDELLIEVGVAGVTFPDLLVSRGVYQDRPELPWIPGLEVAGVVRYAPPGSRFAEGDRVAAACMGGGYAEYATARPELAVKLPDRMGMEAGSGLVVNYQTMHFALHRRASLRSGETVVVYGAAGGIGSAAIQLAKAAGASVIAVCRGREKAALCSRAGADQVIDAEPAESVLQDVLDLTEGRGADLAIDPVGGDGFVDVLRGLAPEGRVLTVGFTGGIPKVALNRVLLRNIGIIGAAWGRFLEQEPSVAQAVGEEVELLASAGLISPEVTAVMPLERGSEAVRALEERRVVGKAGLLVSGKLLTDWTVSDPS